MHAFFHIRTVIIPQLISITHCFVCVCEVNFVVFNSMLKYVINRLMHAFFHIGMITILIWKRACINLYLSYNNHSPIIKNSKWSGVVMVVIVWQLDLQLPVYSVPINFVSSNPVHGEVYSIQQYVTKFVSDLRQVGSFLRALQFPPPIKLTTMI